MLAIKPILGALSVVIAFIVYVPYALRTARGTLHPHAFSWIVWGLLAGIAFEAQRSDHAGPGAWIAACTAFFSFAVAFIAVGKRSLVITYSDWVTFTAALCIFPVWYFLHAFAAVLAVTFIDALGFYPTFRKSYRHPGSEMIVLYASSIMKMALSLAAMERYTPTTIIYPAYLVLANLLFVLMLSWRRGYFRRNQPF